ncbi:hypothetical protein [Lentilactobacillus farraginis]|uniref:Uncharacterized protein n=1 Tax=Lentilactobacillus farraginis DSM 18382 = JCM 14108 TaxID=1423743 RepID=A0A0R1W3C5_9LACO|nr:hypothetical protein [Lentilactobacillus farraginis]KRM12183.1 hypothetical protein FD41_GL000538 [Lentilactobacillus farraginis DSM 18382 = JCM 14108]
MKIEWRYSLINNLPLIALWISFLAFNGLSPRGWSRFSVPLVILGAFWLIYYLFFERSYFRRHPEQRPGSHLISGLGWIMTFLVVMVAFIVLLKFHDSTIASPAILLGSFALISLIRDSLSVKKLAVEK